MNSPSQELTMTNQARVEAFVNLLGLKSNDFEGDKRIAFDKDQKRYLIEMTEEGFMISHFTSADSFHLKDTQSSCQLVFIYGSEGEFLRSHEHSHSFKTGKNFGLEIDEPSFGGERQSPPMHEGDRMIQNLINGLKNGETIRANID